MYYLMKDNDCQLGIKGIRAFFSTSIKLNLKRIKGEKVNNKIVITLKYIEYKNAGK